MKNSSRKQVNHEDAEKMIPAIKKTLIRVQQLNILIQECLKTLKSMHIKFNDNFDNFEDYDQDAVDTISSLKIMLSTVQNEIDELKDQGCMLTNIEKGIVHWNSQHDDKDIVLSWVLGEKPGCHWHYRKSDFKSRKPMKDLTPVV
jgi:hypothetical protein